ncbi:hypothetical protein ACFV2V_11190 [Streptomyces sp. NPDC059698]|uniref:hypothetical protein n=1 Tax=unclassified Streptomyces TaxID=2593676 RepID=UPI00093970EE|nr:hypothetical protein [Streptomyces sp. CB02366]OKJ40827.1 hypothetical protein AMK24_02775 [Streptomyces sp. CB02366]
MKHGDIAYPERGPLRRRTAAAPSRPAVFRRRGAASLAAVAAVAALVSGCGIRTTSVPVDAGAAPSRVPCRLSASDVATPPPGGTTAKVYLVCASQLVTVERPVARRAVGDEPVAAARALLAEVQRAPAAGERRAGFTTAVPVGLRVEKARGDDLAGTVRLSSQPEDLSAEALAQLVCTYAENEALVRDGSVVLGGPGNYPPRGYLCTSQTKARPGDLATTPDAVGLG